MSSLLDTVANGVESEIDSVLGPTYNYAAHIPSPGDLGVSTDGSVDTTMNDIAAGMEYVKYLVTGPNLGNKYFLNTGAQCTKPDGGHTDRFKYIDNSADQPKFSSGVQSGFSKFASDSLEGILPGIMVSMEDLNPVPLFKSLVRDAFPPCAQVTCAVGDVAGGGMGADTQWVLQEDVSDLTGNYGCTAAAAAAVESFEAADTLRRPGPGAWMLLLPAGILLVLAGMHSWKK